MAHAGVRSGLYAVSPRAATWHGVEPCCAACMHVRQGLCDDAALCAAISPLIAPSAQPLSAACHALCLVGCLHGRRCGWLASGRYASPLVFACACGRHEKNRVAKQQRVKSKGQKNGGQTAKGKKGCRRYSARSVISCQRQPAARQGLLPVRLGQQWGPACLAVLSGRLRLEFAGASRPGLHRAGCRIPGFAATRCRQPP